MTPRRVDLLDFAGVRRVSLILYLYLARLVGVRKVSLILYLYLDTYTDTNVLVLARTQEGRPVLPMDVTFFEPGISQIVHRHEINNFLEM